MLGQRCRDEVRMQEPGRLREDPDGGFAGHFERAES